jgi:hypothetical protein
MIFISHKKEDKNKALDIHCYLKEKNVNSYIDVLDPSITYENVAQRIIEQLRKATHLIVVFSEHTKESMWVPFELGVAYERNNGIGIFLWPDNHGLYIKFPEYLDEFPVMKSVKDLDKYIKLYRETKIAMESIDFVKSASVKNYTQQFIDELKSELRR